MDEKINEGQALQNEEITPVIEPVIDPMVTPKKRKSGKKALKIILCVIVAIVVLLFVAFQVFAAIPKNRVILAAAKTAYATAFGGSADESALGMNSFIRTVLSKDNEQKLSLKEKDGSLNLDIMATRDGEKKLTQLALNDKKNSMAYAYVYSDDLQIIFGYPEQYDEMFYTEDKNSEGYRHFQSNMAQCSENSFSSVEAEGDGMVAMKAVGVLGGRLSGAAAIATSGISGVDLMSVYNDLEVEKISEKKFEINGKSKSCKGYSVVIPSKYAKDFFKAAGDASIDEALDSYVTDISGAKNFSELMDKLADNASDVEAEVYLNGGRIVSCSLKLEADDISMSCDLTMLGKKGPLDDLRLKTSFVSDVGEDTVDISIGTEYDKGTGKYSKEARIKLDDYDGCNMTIKSALDYSSDKGSLNFKLVLDSDDVDNVQIMSLKGSVNSIKKGKSLDMDIDELLLGEVGYELEGSYSFTNQNQTIEHDKANSDIDSLNSDDIDKVTDKIRRKICKNVEESDSDVFAHYIRYYYE